MPKAKRTDPVIRAKALELVVSGVTLTEAARQVGVSQSALSAWPEVRNAARAVRERSKQP
jgi:transposase-like protein